MPYITQLARDRVLFSAKPENAGELNYYITELLLDYLGPEVRYQRINDIIGVLECAKLEFYRRLAAPYEDAKSDENGDVERYSLINMKKEKY